MQCKCKVKQVHNQLQDRAELATEEYLPVTPGTILEAQPCLIRSF